MNVLKPFDIGITSNEDAIRDLEDLPVVEPIDLDDIINVNGRQVVRSDYDAVNAVIPKGYSFAKLAEERKIFFNENRVSYLALYEMGLECLSSEIEKLSGLRNLVLYNNKLSFLPEIGSLVELKYLYLQDNELSVLPVEIGNLVKLECLDLHDNCLSVLPEELCDLPNLKWIWVYDNPFSDYAVVEKLRDKGVEVYG